MTDFRLVGTADPLGEIEIWVSSSPRIATVTANGLPAVEVRHPDQFTQGPLPIDEQTVVAVGDANAVLTPGHGVRKADRALRIELRDRSYVLVVTERSVEELRDAEGATLVRIARPLGLKPVTVSTTEKADTTDLSLALAFLTLDTGRLTMTRTIVGGAWNKIFNGPPGEG